MAQYKSFAPKGSFSDFQITAPDESQQIKQETARQMQGMQAAQSFKQKNEAIYLQALKYKFSAEEKQREENFEAETENRRLHQQQEKLNYQTQIQSEAIKAQQKLKGFQDLAQFSKTAFNVYGQIDETLKKSERAALHQIALESGMDLSDLEELRGIDQKLTRSQFNQIEYIQRKIEEGYNPAQIDALFKAFKKSGSNQWVEVSSLYQNAALGHTSFIEAGTEEWLDSFEGQDRQPTLEEINAKVKSLNAEFIELKFPNARPEILESSGVYREIRSNTRATLKRFHTLNAKEQELNLKDAYFKSLASVWKTDGAGGIVREIANGRSRRSRVQGLEWVKNAVLSGTISPENAADILNNRFGQEQSLSERFPGRPEIVDLVQAIETQRRKNNAIVTENLALEKAEVTADAVDFLNSKFSDGVISEESLEVATNMLIEGGGDLRVLEKFRPYSENVVAARELDERWEERLNKTGMLPTMEELNNYYQLPPATRNKWLQLINARKQIQPTIKEHEKAIDNQVKAAPQIQALGSAAASGTVAVLQTRMKQEYKRLLNTMDPDAALAIVLEKIQKIQADPGAFDKNGNYSIIMQELKTDSARGRVNQKIWSDTLEIILKQPRNRRDFKALSTALGANTVFANIDNVIAGRPTTPLFKTTAEALGISPYQLAVTLDKANNLNNEQKLKDAIPDWKELTRLGGLDSKGMRIRNTHRDVVERNHRANVLDSRSGSTARVRQSFSTSFTPAQNAFIQTVAWAEGTSGPDGYNKVYGGAVVPQLTQMTLGELYEATKLGGTDRLPARLGGGIIPFKKDRYNSSASGKLQLMPETLRGLVESGYFSWNDTFDPSTQNKMILILAAGRGVDIENMDEAQMAKAGEEWAGLTPRHGQTTRTARQSLNRFNALRNQ